MRVKLRAVGIGLSFVAHIFEWQVTNNSCILVCLSNMLLSGSEDFQYAFKTAGGNYSNDKSRHYHVLQKEQREGSICTSVNIAVESRGSEDGKRQYQCKLSIALYVMPMYACLCTVDSSSHWKYKVAQLRHQNKFNDYCRWPLDLCYSLPMCLHCLMLSIVVVIGNKRLPKGSEYSQ